MLTRSPLPSEGGNQNKALPPRRGFTLIEVLVVMTIIVILMAALLPVVGMVSLRSKVQATNTLIKTLAGGLEMRRNELDEFPPTPGNGTDPQDDGTLFTSLMGPDGKGVIVFPGTPRQKHYAPFLNIPPEFCRHEGNKVIVIDSFGMPIHYFNCKKYVDGGGNPLYCHNPDSFDIWSYGPDKKKDEALIEPGTKPVEIPAKVKYVDDIKNW